VERTADECDRWVVLAQGGRLPASPRACGWRGPSTDVSVKQYTSSAGAQDLFVLTNALLPCDLGCCRHAAPNPRLPLPHVCQPFPARLSFPPCLLPARPPQEDEKLLRRLASKLREANRAAPTPEVQAKDKLEKDALVKIVGKYKLADADIKALLDWRHSHEF
jgi:hypothetical protein